MSIDWTAVLAIATVLMAGATFWLGIENRKNRIQAEARAKQLAFRGAITEIAGNVIWLHAWNPLLGAPPFGDWVDRTLSFTNLLQMLQTVWIPPQLWERIIAILRKLESVDRWLRYELIGKDQEQAKVVYFLIDLYLKQLLCYIVSEMRKQGLSSVQESSILKLPLMRPAPWFYGDKSLPSDTVAALLESQPIAPFSELPKEIEDPHFADCRLSVLIEEARRAHEELFSLRSGVTP